MTSAIDGSIMTLGPDGTLLLASRKRQEYFEEEMQEAAKTTTTTMPADYDGRDEDLNLITLLEADLAKAKPALMGRHQVDDEGIILDIAGEGGDDGGDGVNGDTAAAETRVNTAIEDSLRRHLAQVHQTQGGQEQQEAEVADETASATTPNAVEDAGGSDGDQPQGAKERGSKCGNNVSTAGNVVRSLLV